MRECELVPEGEAAAMQATASFFPPTLSTGGTDAERSSDKSTVAAVLIIFSCWLRLVGIWKVFALTRQILHFQ